MGNSKTCPKGHLYDSTQYPICPYCPENREVIMNIGTNSTGVNSPTKTLKSKVKDTSGDADSQNKASKTIISRQEDEGIIHAEDGQGRKKLILGKALPTRRLIGWLVSFSIHPNGVDFKLFEGKNIVGSDSQCDIAIPTDPLISGKHLTILYRQGTVKFKDEFSTNGTFINGEFKEEGELADGDVIKLGNTLIKYRAV